MNHDDTQLNLPQREEQILKFWDENHVFEQALKKTAKGKKFVFYEGPPFANGHPGIHHAETRVFKDAFIRFKTMQGYSVPRKAGWDTHGLPVELQVEKELGLKTKKDIERYGIGAFNRKCRENVWKYKNEWEAFTKRIGFWLDLENPYVTYEPSYIESLWAIIKRFWETKALYRDYKILPWCSRCGTGLSSHELGQPGAYRKITDQSVYVKFPLVGKNNESLLIWTTTPWTLPGNVAVAVNPKIEYLIIHSDMIGTESMSGDVQNLTPGSYIVSKDALLHHLLKEGNGINPFMALLSSDDHHLLATGEIEKSKNVKVVKGEDLLGLKYEAPFPAKKGNIPYEVIAGDFVTTEDGTGLVHIAPAFGEDDMNAVKKTYGEKYPILLTVNAEGKMEPGVTGEGVFAKHADKGVIEDLSARGLLFKKVPYEHEYPHCWRCDTPLLYLARESWWVKKPVEKLLKNNQSVSWIPEYIKDGRFGEWLSEKKDWAFSRERYWGTPLPMWHCEKCKTYEAIGGIEELVKKSRPTKNRYIMVRHGQAEHNLLGVIDSSPETYSLTDKGRKEAEAAAKKLAKEGVDLIFSSDFKRTRETAAAIAGAAGIKTVHYDERLREINLGVLDGLPVTEYHKKYATYDVKFEHRPEGGEALSDLRARVIGFMKDIEEKYSGKTILIVSHEYPLWILWTSGQGMGREEIIAVKSWKKKQDFIKTAEIKEFPFKNLPYSDTGEVDLHRPYIDEVELACSSCDGTMKRVPEVCDVWFDSGAMPFAQHHWPFEETKGKSTKPPALFPADFICEGVDQTRGWFYTLLTVSTLLDFKAPYKNVMSLGHVLDAKGQKMSKSKGNVVVPEELIAKYGVDALRWYFYTINGPGDAKQFDEKDVATRLRGFLNTFWNSFVLFETYAPKKITLAKAPSPKNVLDQWVLSRLQTVTENVTEKMDAYDPVGAARELEEFLIGDVSQWHLRRSRRRFQKPKDEKELSEVSQVSAHVLLELAKLSAPFTPFFSEMIFQRLRGKVGLKETSIHLTLWPAGAKKAKNERLEEEMKKAREMTAQALQERAKAGIKVRQPLQSLSIPDAKFKYAELLDIVKDEINVKEIKAGAEFKLDTAITPELREEGNIRELVRNIQEMRKDGGLKPQDRITIWFAGSDDMMRMVGRWTKQIRDEAGAKELTFGPKKDLLVDRDTKIDDHSLSIGIRKI